MARVISVCSGKGGTGKTVSAINLGIALNSLGKSVAIVDANLTMPNVALHLGAPSPPVTLSHVLHGKNSIHDAIYAHSSGTKIIPGGISLNAIPKTGKETNERFGKALQHLKRTNDFVIIDSAPGLNDESMLALKAGDEIIIVTNPELPSVTDALKTVKMANKMNKTISGVIVNRIRNDNIELPAGSLKSLLEIPIIAKVPEDIAVRHSIASRNAVVITNPRSPAGQAYMKLASKIADSNYTEELGFFERFRSWFKR